MGKRNQSQNLIPSKLVIGHIKDLVLPKIILIVVLCTLFTLAYYYGCDKATVHFSEQTNKVIATSAKTEADKQDIKIAELNEEIENLNTTFRTKDSQIKHMSIEVVRDTRIHDLTDYVVSNKPSDITLILMEDMLTHQLYSLVGSDESSEHDYGFNMMNEFNPELLNNSGNLCGEIRLRGYAVDKNVLSKFLIVIGNYPEIVSYRVFAVEEVKFGDKTLSLFDIQIEI